MCFIKILSMEVNDSISLLCQMENIVGKFSNNNSPPRFVYLFLSDIVLCFKVVLCNLKISYQK